MPAASTTPDHAGRCRQRERQQRDRGRRDVRRERHPADRVVAVADAEHERAAAVAGDDAHAALGARQPPRGKQRRHAEEMKCDHAQLCREERRQEVRLSGVQSRRSGDSGFTGSGASTSWKGTCASRAMGRTPRPAWP